jgi:hypothetical protein
VVERRQLGRSRQTFRSRVSISEQKKTAPGKDISRRCCFCGMITLCLFCRSSIAAKSTLMSELRNRFTAFKSHTGAHCPAF